MIITYINQSNSDSAICYEKMEIHNNVTLEMLTFSLHDINNKFHFSFCDLQILADENCPQVYVFRFDSAFLRCFFNYLFSTKVGIHSCYIV